MQIWTSHIWPFLILTSFSACIHAAVIEIDASAFGTQGAPLPEYIKAPKEKLIVVHPGDHVWGAYNAKGRLIRWGIATSGGYTCRSSDETCKTTSGSYRIYSLGNESCISKKYPEPTGGAPMPYCMFFNGGMALHGSPDVKFSNVSHGCVRIHEPDAKWLRYHFVEAPNPSNNHRGTRILIKDY